MAKAAREKLGLSKDRGSTSNRPAARMEKVCNAAKNQAALIAFQGAIRGVLAEDTSDLDCIKKEI